jgi:hypothetical protein
VRVSSRTKRQEVKQYHRSTLAEAEAEEVDFHNICITKSSITWEGILSIILKSKLFRSNICKDAREVGQGATGKTKQSELMMLSTMGGGGYTLGCR